jgi:ABC-2 type transport system ATP-binding protein
MEVIRAEKVSKRFGTIFQLGPLDLRVEAGQILGVVGPAGSGKTTLLQLLWGFMRPDEGSISVFGMQPHLNQPRLRYSVGYLPQNPRLPRLPSCCTAKQFLEFACHFYGGWNETQGSHLLGQLDIDPHSKIKNLSNEGRIKVALVAAASHKPALLLLDEPTSTIDDETRLGLLRFLRRLAVEDRVAILLSCCLPDDLDYIADSVLILKDGQPVEYVTSFR